MRFDDRVTGNPRSYAPGAKKIHFEIDSSEVNKNVKVDLALVGDLRETLNKLLPLMRGGDHSEWLRQIETIRGDSALRDIQNQPTDGKLHGAHVVSDLWQLTHSNAIVVTDVGQNQMWAAQYYRREDPHTFICSGGLGTMGFAIPAAIGAKLACPDREVWAVVGDGGFQMTQAELSTAAQEGVKVNIAVLNNGFLGMVRQWQEFFYNRRYAGTPLLGPDFVKIAEAHGLTGLRVTQRGQLAEAIRQARATSGTVIIDCQVEAEDNVYPMVPSGADLHNMIRRPLPNQDLLEDAEE
jgi:acetolactate synthase-1/2/3 large subunit